MIESIAANLVNLKKEFANIYDGKSQIQEAIPTKTCDLFPVEQQHLELLHQFAAKNPIYYNSYDLEILGVPCIVYEGDINKYWLNSIKYDSSHAPFSPTWMMSAFIGVIIAKEMGFTEVVDIGSGDGRIAFCAKVLDLESYSIELDDMLVELQNLLCTTLDFHPFCSDATSFDYSKLHLFHPMFFIGGLAQMGGIQLASGVLGKVFSIDEIMHNTGWVFTGTISPKYQPDEKGDAGWGTLLEKNNLKSVRTVFLPTVWTFSEPDETPYVFAQFSKR